MNPSTRDSLRPETSATATLLLSALAMYRRAPSGDSANASGVEPTGAFGARDVRMVSVTAFPAITLTVFDPEFATNRRPSFDQTISLGWLPTGTRAVSRSAAGSNRLTDWSPQFEIASVFPSGEKAAL